MIWKARTSSRSRAQARGLIACRRRRGRSWKAAVRETRRNAMAPPVQAKAFSRRGEGKAARPVADIAAHTGPRHLRLAVADGGGKWAGNLVGTVPPGHHAAALRRSVCRSAESASAEPRAGARGPKESGGDGPASDARKGLPEPAATGFLRPAGWDCRGRAGPVRPAPAPAGGAVSEAVSRTRQTEPQPAGSAHGFGPPRRTITD